MTSGACRLECVPMGTGGHWDELEQSPMLRSCLDSLLGQGCWEMPLNSPPSDGGSFIRHWYSPVVFPELVHAVDDAKPSIPIAEETVTDPVGQSEGGAGGGFRRALLESWKGEIAINGPLEKGMVSTRWQPVNRRRFCSKGWHIDIGPGFEMDDVRTLKGDPRQGVVLLLLLSDWHPVPSSPRLLSPRPPSSPLSLFSPLSQCVLICPSLCTSLSPPSLHP